ncbi:SPEECHLESS [Hibiscus trionum]|uniref:SPEECHLESS n=1 Tax=Hibiscus trionum TaxID=183268 RepID=A0A9W7HGV6_HIBTR|nr:SPEECHLESS [Hibiscus trionum]
MDDSLYDLFEEAEFGPGGDDDLFAFFESFDGISEFPPFTPLDEPAAATCGKDDEETTTLVTQKCTSSSTSEVEHEPDTWPKSKKPKLASSEETNPDGQQRMSHITVERNRRKQMNEHISVLRSLMPCFYVKRGDQASIIGGVVDYISELQQVLQSLEAKKQRKVMSEVLSPRVVSSPRPSPLSPRKPPLSPRLNLPISPRTPQSGSPYMPRLHHQGYLSPTMPIASLEPSPTSSTSSVDNVNELVANAKSAIADVEVKFSGPNLVLKTVSPPIPGQAVKIISALEDLSLEILDVNIHTIDDTMLNSFTIKIGIECQLSAEELAHQIQQTFS